jgi:hypothetical protein
MGNVSEQEQKRGAGSRILKTIYIKLLGLADLTMKPLEHGFFDIAQRKDDEKKAAFYLVFASLQLRCVRQCHDNRSYRICFPPGLLQLYCDG